ncbi:SIR2 family protein [Runella aurantiaca]|uniref:Uncharacterized protein n=1 Tax=Runella aurantiaca TaxID=2282308 RepID=A0A369I482_9BACT|nr:SIR2 family protein [Runella aurantiaca]RDB02323.1 hypothetical protein DVG78_29470 [Runella aurantiaca]
MEHIIDLDKQRNELVDIFKNIRDSNTILFLGAGASIGEKKYLSQELIELYEQYLCKNLNEKNITNFIDILSADETFSRKHFDDFVLSLLKKLKVTEAHKILATIPWREIITTNYDLLVEMAYDEISGTSKHIYDLKTIRSIKEINYKESNTEVKYIKLNGCMKDKSQYPFAFSTDDFLQLKSFYKAVLQDLKNLSTNINFLSIGYSYSDAFGRELLDKFDSYNYREKRWMINVDPFPNENALAYYKQKKVCIVKCSFEDFFKKYNEWDLLQNETVVRKKGLSIFDSKNQYLSFPPKLLLNLEGIVKQLSVEYNRDRVIKDSDFYKGEEPNFNLISRGVDVVKNKYLLNFKNTIVDVIKKNHSTIIPMFFINGDFGIGKSTFALRLVHELEKDIEFDLVAFEIIEFNRVKKELLIDLVNNCKSKNLLFYCDEIEVESYFKTLLDIQRDLSIEQFQGCNVFILASIRENILEKFKLNRNFSRMYNLKLEGKFEKDEIEDLLEKLKKTNLVSYRDASEKNMLVEKIESSYNSDSFISLMATVTSGKHENDLIDSYNQLSSDTQKAFLYTALLHKHKLLMPASWLKQNISMSWEEFTEKVINAEGKGILIQEVKMTHGTQPDLYFRTKHPLIAEKLVERFLENKDKQFAFYDRMLKTIEPGQTNSYLVNNLLKAFIKSGEYSETQLNKLFDSGYTKLSDDPYYLLNYAINLQSRREKKELKKALTLLVYAESLFDYRNHRFIHRRGSISFDLAKLYFEESFNSSYVTFYLNEAKDLFFVKQILDPFSAYSYVDYIKLFIWELKNLDYDDEDKVQKQIKIEELLDIAYKTVSDGIERVDVVNSSYINNLKEIINDLDYKEYLDSLYEKSRLRPYACILLFGYHNSKGEYLECNRLLDEMESYQENFEIVKFLFKHYGRNLHDPNVRIKLMRLSRQNPDIERDNSLRFNYFNFIAETYNYNFMEGKRYLQNINSKFNNINPEFHYVWLDSLGEEVLFEARITKKSNEKIKSIKIPSIQQNIRLIKGNYDNLVIGNSASL